MIKFLCPKDKAFICSDCLLESYMGHEIIPAKPYLVGEAIKEKAKDIN
jgi:hypothetical protein